MTWATLCLGLWPAESTMSPVSVRLGNTVLQGWGTAACTLATIS